jgi:hypothetical protein
MMPRAAIAAGSPPSEVLGVNFSRQITSHPAGEKIDIDADGNIQGLF